MSHNSGSPVPSGSEPVSGGREEGRVVAEHKERYIVRTAGREYDAEITGALRFAAESREDYPAVGDRVEITPYDDGFAIIHRILPRTSLLRRQAAGQPGGVQVVAANVDVAFLVQAADRDFNPNRLERYLTLCYDARIQPVILLTKTDLAGRDRTEALMEILRKRIGNVPVAAISNETREGYEILLRLIEKGKTYCLLGSSGAGKSTLLNNLSGEAVMKTGSISESTGKGKHVTSHRELTTLENGGFLIDNPGMREVGIEVAAGGLETTFDAICRLAENCRYGNCTHRGETGCAVTEALRNGLLDEASYENYLRMEREREHYEATTAQKRQKEKSFGKMLKEYNRKDPKKRKP